MIDFCSVSDRIGFKFRSRSSILWYLNANSQDSDIVITLNNLTLPSPLSRLKPEANTINFFTLHTKFMWGRGGGKGCCLVPCWYLSYSGAVIVSLYTVICPFCFFPYTRFFLSCHFISQGVWETLHKAPLFDISHSILLTLHLFDLATLTP